MPSRFLRPCRFASLFLGGLLAFSAAIAQTPTSPVPPYAAPAKATLSLKTKLGSFRLLPKGPIPIQGKFTISFTGTILISGMKGTIQPSGNIRQEVNDVKHQRQVFFGTGKLVMNGQYKAVQWFGRDMNAVFEGFGIFQLYGEYDKNLETGIFSYDNYKTVQKWETYGRAAYVPEMNSGLMKPLQPRDVTPKKKSG